MHFEILNVFFAALIFMHLAANSLKKVQCPPNKFCFSDLVL